MEDLFFDGLHFESVLFLFILNVFFPPRLQGSLSPRLCQELYFVFLFASTKRNVHYTPGKLHICFVDLVFIKRNKIYIYRTVNTAKVCFRLLVCVDVFSDCRNSHVKEEKETKTV